MPEVVAEGRRSINNLQRSAAPILLRRFTLQRLHSVASLLPYPFIPVQMSLCLLQPLACHQKGH